MTRVSLSDMVPGGPSEPPSRRGSVRANERRKKRKRRRSFLVLVVALSVLGGAGYGAYAAIMPMIRSATAPNDYTGAGSGQVEVVVPTGASGTTIARVLAKAGVTKTVEAFVDVFNQDPDAAAVQPGTYSLKKQMSAENALAALLDPANRVEKKVTIVEGERKDEIVPLLAKGLGIPEADFTAALKDPASIGLPAEAKGNPEGYLFPSTYTFGPDVTATEVLKTMVAKGQQVMTDAGVAPKDARRTLILASLVQAESGDEKYMSKVAQVLFNRLDKKIKLSLDTTVHYATKKFTLKTTFADTRVKSPYNTYYVPALPVGPICSPGAAAIDAVLHPTPGPWIFFTTTNPDTGETKFATTTAEKAKMDAEFRAWQKDHPNA